MPHSNIAPHDASDSLGYNNPALQGELESSNAVLTLSQVEKTLVGLTKYEIRLFLTLDQVNKSFARRAGAL